MTHRSSPPKTQYRVSRVLVAINETDTPSLSTARVFISISIVPKKTATATAAAIENRLEFPVAEANPQHPPYSTPSDSQSPSTRSLTSSLHSRHHPLLVSSSLFTVFSDRTVSRKSLRTYSCLLWNPLRLITEDQRIKVINQRDLI